MQGLEKLDLELLSIVPMAAAAGAREPFTLVYSLVSVNYPCAIFKGVSHHTCRQNNVIHNGV